MSPPVEGGCGPAPRRPNFLVLFGIIGFGSCIVLMILAATFVLPSLRRAGEVRQERICLSRLRELSRAMRAYAIDNDGKLPAAEFKLTELRRFVRPSRFVCPKTQKAFVYNTKLAGRSLESIQDPEHTVLFSEVDKPHKGGENYGLASGASRSAADLTAVKWTHSGR